MKTTSNYQQQAIDFLNKVNATIKIEYHSYGKHFEDDKESRNIYNVTVKRNGKQFNFKFGDSIANTKAGHEPCEYDVLACITKSEPEDTFEDFCSSYGYDTDSRKAERIYKAIQREFKGINRVFGDVLEQLQEIN